MRTVHCNIICHGIAMGKTMKLENVSLEQKNEPFVYEDEVKKLNDAFELSINDLDTLVKYNETNEFITAHKLLLEDPVLRKEIIAEIKKKRTAEASFIKVLDKYSKNMKSATSEYLRQRYVDFLDIKNRVLMHFLNKKYEEVDEGVILVVEELLPSILLESKYHINGVISKHGSTLSHGAIICAAREIPYVISNESFASDETLIIDTPSESILINPTSEIKEKYESINAFKVVNNYDYSKYGIHLYLNVSSNRGLEKIDQEDIWGIGLYRSEFIFMNKLYPISYEQELAIFNDLIDKVPSKPIIIRTFDIGDDKLVPYLKTLGKGIDNYKRYPEIFETQVKSILHANKNGNISLMFPMIETIEEYNYLYNWVDMIAREEKLKMPVTGMMLETAKALENLDDFAEVPFFSVGSNDLMRELYNIDRSSSIEINEEIENDFILKMEEIVLFCEKNDIKLSICGEIATKTEVCYKLLRVGVKNFSASSGNLVNISKTIDRFLFE